jgi:SAM-dependent methyltransferase
MRKRVVGGAKGRVLEIGVGVGTNLAYLPEGAEYTGIEPDPHMLERAKRNAAGSGRSFDLQPHDVQSLPYPDASFDTVISTLTFCSVPDAARGLGEVHRVLKPGGAFRFGEHVRSKRRAMARAQRHFITPLTRRLAGGCEHHRDTLAAIRTAGLEIAEVSEERVMGLPVVTGVARRPA